MSKFTPGPWHVEYENSETGKWYEIHKDSFNIMDMGWNCTKYEEVVALANATLAAAAPDLLEAAIHALGALRSNPDSPMTASECLLSLAIAKALGETNED